MKVKTIGLTVTLVWIMLTSQVTAAPMYYTFEGSVTQVVDSTGSIVDDYGSEFGIGSNVNYVFMLDFDEEGTISRNYGGTGSTSTYETATTIFDYFYAELISGDIVTIDDAGYYNNPSSPGYDRYEVSDRKYGVQQTSKSTGESTTRILSNSRDQYTYLRASGYAFNELIVGVTGLTFSTRDIAETSEMDAIRSDLTLVRISDSLDAAPVPEPSTFLLLGSGLVGLIFLRRKRRIY